MDTLLQECKKLARQAGEAVMRVYESGDFAVELKSDNSPVTKADMLANRIIERGLKQFSDYPIISEEGSHDAKGSDTFWLVDPLDGTKEFIKRNGEFTVNIGLIKNREPILGVVYAPAKNVLYTGSSEAGAFKQADGGEAVRISAVFRGPLPVLAGTRSHPSEEMETFLRRFGEHRIISMGSSLKFCLVAEGVAALYPRFVPCWLWDSAAGDAIVRAAGGSVTDLRGEALTYRPAHDLQNPYFIAATRNGPYRNVARDMMSAV